MAAARRGVLVGSALLVLALSAVPRAGGRPLDERAVWPRPVLLASGGAAGACATVGGLSTRQAGGDSVLRGLYTAVALGALCGTDDVAGGHPLGDLRRLASITGSTRLTVLKLGNDTKVGGQNVSEVVDVKRKGAYALQVGADGSVTVWENSRASLAHAFATLRQLRVGGHEGCASAAPEGPTTWEAKVCGLPIQVIDAPAFEYRGFLLDSARYRIPVRFVLNLLYAMAFLKLSHLHWHLTDDGGFALPLATLPHAGVNLTDPDGGRIGYTLQEVTHVVRTARFLGISVVPELDLPAHAHAWAPWQVDCPATARADRWRYKKFPALQNVASWGNPIDVGKPGLYDTLRQVFHEVRHMFHINHEEYLHVGGDEVNGDCLKEGGHITLPFAEPESPFAEPESPPPSPSLTLQKAREARKDASQPAAVGAPHAFRRRRRDPYDTLVDPEKSLGRMETAAARLKASAASVNAVLEARGTARARESTRQGRRWSPSPPASQPPSQPPLRPPAVHEEEDEEGEEDPGADDDVRPARRLLAGSDGATAPAAVAVVQRRTQELAAQRNRLLASTHAASARPQDRTRLLAAAHSDLSQSHALRSAPEPPARQQPSPALEHPSPVLELTTPTRLNENEKKETAPARASRLGARAESRGTGKAREARKAARRKKLRSIAVEQTQLAIHAFNVHLEDVLDDVDFAQDHVIRWDEVLDVGHGGGYKPPKGSVIEGWRALDDGVVWKALDQGYRAIRAHGYYFNVEYENGRAYPWGCKTWSDCYQTMPTMGMQNSNSKPLPKELAGNVLGGEACAWALPTRDYPAKVWVKLIAVAERFWSDPRACATGELRERIEAAAVRLRRSPGLDVPHPKTAERPDPGPFTYGPFPPCSP